MKRRLYPFSVRRTMGKALSTAFRVFPSIFLFELCFKIIVNLILRPLLSEIIQIFLYLNGKNLVLNESIGTFFKSPMGIIGGLVWVVIAALLIFFEFGVIIHLAAWAYKGKKLPIAEAMKRSLISMKTLLSPGFIGFCIYAMVLLPFVNVGVGSSLIPSLRLPNFVTGELTKMSFGPILLGGVTVIAFLLFVCLVFVLPNMVLKREYFFKAVRSSFFLPRGRRGRVFLTFVGFFLIWSLTYLPMLLSLILFVYGESIGVVAGPVFITLATMILTALLQMALMPILLSFIVSIFFELGGRINLREDLELERFERRLDSLHGLFHRVRSHRTFQKPFYIRWLPRFAAIVIAVSIPVLIFRWISPNISDLNQSEKYLIGHRGSHQGVENTLEAIQGAMDAEADYAEIDILLSKDNVPMVIHDTNLKRLAGKNLEVYELTAAELKALTLEEDGETGKIPTLAELLRFCKGKQKLLIEFKTHGHETESVVKRTFEVVEEENFQYEAIYHTLVYDCLKEAKNLRPHYDVGYITYLGLGSSGVAALQALGCDFIVVEEGMFSRELVYRATQASLPVFVWTVNELESMRNYFDDGAKGVITDYPEYRQEVFEEDDESYFLRLLDDLFAAQSVSVAA